MYHKRTCTKQTNNPGKQNNTYNQTHKWQQRCLQQSLLKIFSFYRFCRPHSPDRSMIWVSHMLLTYHCVFFNGWCYPVAGNLSDHLNCQGGLQLTNRSSERMCRHSPRISKSLSHCNDDGEKPPQTFIYNRWMRRKLRYDGSVIL